MSSSLTVYIADTGQPISLSVPNISHNQGLNIPHLKQVLALHSNITVNSQIIITSAGNVVSNPKTELQSQLLASSTSNLDNFLYQQPWYLFNRAHLKLLSKNLNNNFDIKNNFLDASTLKTSFENKKFSIKKLSIPSSETSPLLKAIYEYHYSFQYHLAKGNAYKESLSIYCKSVEKAINKSVVLSNALDAASKNLAGHYEKLEMYIGYGQKDNNFNNFSDIFTNTVSRFSKIISTLEDDLKMLLDVKLLPALFSSNNNTLDSLSPRKKDNKTSLLDCVNEALLRQKSTEALKNLDLLKSHYKDLVILYKTISEGLNTQLKVKLMVWHKEKLDITIEKLQQSDNNCLNVLQDDLHTINRIIENINISSSNNNITSSQADILPAASKMGEIEILNQKHINEILPEMNKNDEELFSILEECYHHHNDSVTQFYYNLHSISLLESSIRDINGKIVFLRDALSHQETLFEQFSKLHNMPTAYNAALAEIVRRRAYNTLFKEQAQKYALLLTNLREQEQSKREMFVQKYGKSLPRNFIPSLNQKPTYCDLQIYDSDRSLPLISPNDLPLSSKGLIDIDSNEAIYEEDEIDIKKTRTGSLIIPAPMNTITSLNPDHVRRIKEENSMLRAELALQKVEVPSFDLKDNDKKPQSSQTKMDESTITDISNSSSNVQNMLSSVESDRDEKLAYLVDLLKKSCDKIEIGEVKKKECITKLQNEISELTAKCELLEKANTELKVQAELSHGMMMNRISFRNFEINDIALFHKTPNGHWVAFNLDCPNRFLAKEVITQIPKKKEFFLGEVVQIEKKISAKDSNPFDLPNGVEYFIVTAFAHSQQRL